MHRRYFLVSAATPALAIGMGTETETHSKAHGASADSDRAAALHRDSTVVIIHDHRPIGPDVPLMRAGGVTAKVYQLGVDVDIGAKFQASAAVRGGWFNRTRAALEEAQRTIDADPRRLLLALKPGDIEQAKRDGKIAIVFGVEGGKLLEGDLENLRLFHRLGLRELQLRWAVPNQLVETDSLTAFGRAVVRECRKLGIVIDLTHIPEPAFHQVLDLADGPVIVSHGTGRELGQARVKALVERRGVVGIHFYSSYLGARPTVSQALEAIDYLAQRGAIDIVGLGVDFFPTDGPWRDFQRAQGTVDVSWAIPDSSHMPKVTAALLARGYSDRDIKAILGTNFLRLWKTVMHN